jgi:hypothetical protein
LSLRRPCSSRLSSRSRGSARSICTRASFRNSGACRPRSGSSTRTAPSSAAPFTAWIVDWTRGRSSSSSAFHDPGTRRSRGPRSSSTRSACA